MKNVIIKQKWKFDPHTIRRSNQTGVRAGKEYWVKLIDEVLTCRRGPNRYGFMHMCTPNGQEIRQSRLTDKYTYCLNCNKKFPTKQELTKLASITYPDLKTIKFVASLIKN